VIQKTEAIVLRTLRHQESNLIATLYTREFGIRTCIIKGFHSARSRNRHSYFQPMSLIDIVFQQKESRDIQNITETRISNLLHSIQSDPVKLSLGLAICEIFYDTVKEEEANPGLFDFLRNVILALDESEGRMIQVFIWYLLHLTRFLGFFPRDQSADARQVQFDQKEGVFGKGPGDESARMLRLFYYSHLAPVADPESCRQITFDTETKRQMIRTLFEYYQIHIQGFRYPQTMRVFAEVFG
jgi:DNA repair protein RecO (recombination protein O)